MIDNAGVRVETLFLHPGPDDDALTDTRAKAVATLSTVAERRGLELDVDSVLLERSPHRDEVLMEYSAFAYPPGLVPE